MTDHLVPSDRSENMSKIRSKDTKPEQLLRKALHSLGFRYRLYVKELPGCPDILLPKYKTVIDVRGCFWHGHDCRRGNRPKSNQEYWDRKIQRNIERDTKNNEILLNLGWRVIIVWECQCSTIKGLEDTIDSIVTMLVINNTSAI